MTDSGTSTGGSVQDDQQPDHDAGLDPEVVQLRRRVAELESGRRSTRALRAREVASRVLMVVTVVAVVLAVTAVWIDRTLFVTDAFMTIAEPALLDPDVDEVLADRLAAEVTEALALEERLSAALEDVQTGLGDQLAIALDVTPQQRARLQALPLPELQQLAAPIAAGLESRIEARIDQLVQSERFRSLVLDGTRDAHDVATALLRGDVTDRPNVVIVDGEVRIDLVPAVAAALGELVDEGLDAVGIDEVPFVDPTADPEVRLARLSDALGVDLPPDFGQITVLGATELADLQTTAARMEQFVWLVVGLVVVLAALTLLLATDRRRRLVQLALGTALAAVVVMPITRALSQTIADAASSPQGARVVAVITDVTLDSLRSAMVVVLAVSLAVALVAHVAGRPPWMSRAMHQWDVRGRGVGDPGALQFVARRHDLLVAVVLAVAVVTLWIAGISAGTVIAVVVVTAAVLGLLSLVQRRLAPTLPQPEPEAEAEPEAEPVAHGRD
jgi:hypothetical protein